MFQQNEDSSTKQGLNLKIVRLISYPDYFILELKIKSNSEGLKMIIERNTGNIYEIDFSTQIPDDQLLCINEYSLFLGIIEIFQNQFLILSEYVNKICQIEQDIIYELKTPTFIRIQNIQEQDVAQEQQSAQYKDLKYQIERLQKLLSFGYYFSYSYDLTLNLQKREQMIPTHSSFIWNNFLFQDLKRQNISDEWFTPIMQGFIGCYSGMIKQDDFLYILISRRSSKRAGTRFNARGIDDYAYVANFCETEQIIKFNNIIASHVQIRGSVPIFFEQVGLTNQTNLTRNFDMTHATFEKHFRLLEQTYQNVLNINLMAKSKGGEQILTDSYEKHIQKLDSTFNVKYEYYDFHQACHGEQFHHSNQLIRKLLKINDEFGFYMEDQEKQEFVKEQNGVIRTNCLDCLDRTNYIKTKIAAVNLENIIKSIEQYSNNHHIRSYLYANDDEQLNFYEEIDKQNDQISEFTRVFKHLWADNGDNISLHYTGTGSTHTNITRQGKRNFIGLVSHKWTSVNRFYKQVFEDDSKQSCINQLLGTTLSHSYSNQNNSQTIDNNLSMYDDHVRQMLKEREGEFYDIQNIELLVVNWNINNRFIPSNDYQLNQKIFNTNHQPDLIFISLQQTINSEQSIEQWDKCMESNINNLNTNQYVLVEKKQFNGMKTYIYSSQQYVSRIANIVTQTHKFEHNNKGTINTSLKIDDSQFSFINCELDDYDNNHRLQDFEEIHTQFATPQQWQQKDYSVLSGSLNFQLLLQQQEGSYLSEKLDYISSLIKANNYSNQTNSETFQKLQKELDNRLLKFDELIQAKQNPQQLKQFYEYIQKYYEAPIMYLPTSYYNKYSVIYKQKQDQFQISYNQRIMFWSLNKNNIVKQYLYNAKEQCIESQHRPVVAYYQIPLKRLIQSRRDMIIKQIYDEIKEQEDISLQKQQSQ